MRKTSILLKPAAASVAQVVSSQEVAAMMDFIKNFEMKNAARKLAGYRKKNKQGYR